MDTSKWKLYRVLYDYDGWKDIEGMTSDEERFNRRLKKLKADNDESYIHWLIGTAIKLENGDTHIRVELEGSKENLDLVLAMINENKQNEAKGEQ